MSSDQTNVDDNEPHHSTDEAAISTTDSSIAAACNNDKKNASSLTITTDHTTTTSDASTANVQPDDQPSTSISSIERSKEITTRATGTTNPTGSTTTKHNYITELGPDDILLGRGAPIINYVGNVKFRALVRTRKADYITSARHKLKDKVAKSIMKEIHRRGGRFLKRIESKTDATDNSLIVATKLYQVADNEVALEKVKQALRDKDPDINAQRLQQETAITREHMIGLEEAAALSGISTLSALHQQHINRQISEQTAQQQPSTATQEAHQTFGMNTSLSSVSGHSARFTPSLASSFNSGMLNSEGLGHQHIHSVPGTARERFINEARMNLLNEELQRRQQQQDQQLVLELIHQSSSSSNNSNNNNDPGMNRSIIQQSPLSPRTMLSLLQQSNNSTLNNLSGAIAGASNIGSNLSINDILQRNQQNILMSSLARNSIASDRMNLTSTHDIFSTQLPNMTDVLNQSNMFTNNNVSQATTNLLEQQQRQQQQQQQRQYQQQLDQCNAAILAHSALSRAAASATSGSNNLGLASAIGTPAVSILNSNTMADTPMRNDSIGLQRASSGRQASFMLPLSMEGKISGHQPTLDLSSDRKDDMLTRKRKSSYDSDTKLSPKSKAMERGSSSDDSS